MASYTELLSAFKAMVPPAVAAKEGTPEFGDLFNRWTADIEKELGVQGWDAIPVERITEFEFNPDATPGVTTNGPAEQTIWNAIAPGVASQIAGDATRATDVTKLTEQTDAAFGNLTTTLGQAAAVFDGAAYLQRYPDVAAAYAANNEGLTPAQFAQKHYETYGKNEGRQPAYTSQAAQNNLGAINDAAGALTGAATTAAASKLTALETTLASLQGNLSGALRDQATALATAVASLNQNINTLDASQKQNLAAQIQAQQANLEKSVAAQRAALEQQVNELQGNATQAAQARRAALAQQISELTAAQAPLSEARVKGAEALVTAINLGLEGTRDQLRADAAREGLTGGSTMQDAALARATIGARQDAARTGADARIANAADTRAIGNLGANQGYSIADAYATDRQTIGNMGAVGRGNLSNNLATGTQSIGDYGATQTRSIGDTSANNRFGVGNWGASTAYGDALTGITANRTLVDQAATGRYNISDALADQNQDITNNAAGAKLNLTSGLFPAAVNAAQIATSIPAATAAARTALIPYGTAGARDAMSLLNWWSSPATAPNPTATTTAPSTTGNSIANLGAGLLGGAFQIGNAYNWGAPRTTPAATTPTVTTPTGTPAAGRGDPF